MRRVPKALVLSIFATLPMTWAAAENPLEKKLRTIIIPALKLEEESLSSALYRIRRAAKEHDLGEPDLDQRGIQLVVIPPGGAELARRSQTTGIAFPGIDRRVGASKISLDQKDVTLETALRAIGEAAGLDVHVEQYAVVIGERPEPASFQITKAGRHLGEELKTVKVPTVRVDESTWEEFLLYVGWKASESAPPGSVLKEHRLNTVPLQLGSTLELSLEGLPVSELLRYAAAQSGVQVRVERNAVVVGNDLPAKPVAPSATERKLSAVVLPELVVEDALPMVAEQLEKLAARAGEPEFEIKVAGEGWGEYRKEVYLRLEQISLWDAIRYSALQAGAEISVEAGVVVLRAEGAKE